MEREDGDPDSDEENYNGEESRGIFFSLPFGNSLWILGDVQKMESKQGYLVHKVYRLEKRSSFIAHNVEMAKLQQ